jgi:hypothetical protein
LIAALRAANQSGSDRKARILAQGHAYVRYALEQPARFDLMWRYEALNLNDPAHRAAGFEAFSLLHEVVTGVPAGDCDTQNGPGQPINPKVAAVWSLVHGFAQLARQGSFDAETPGLLEGVLATLDV